MKSEIISIGSELTTGQNIDTHSQWLSKHLGEIGIPVAFHTTVSDDLADNISVFRAAVDRADLVVATGGLGPTLDDLTREVLAKTAGVDLYEDSESLKFIEELFRRRNRTMPERNRIQAQFPKGSEPLANPIGTAPGIWMPIAKSSFDATKHSMPETIVVAMPGVPSEMYRMFYEQVVPRLQKLGQGSGVLLERKINTFGEGESALEQRLVDITKRGRVPEVGITASDAIISLRIIARGKTREEAEAQIAPTEQLIRERLGSLVYGTGSDNLQDIVMQLLKEKKKTIATAECVTSGLIAHRLGQISGSRNWFRGAIVANNRDWKIRELGVPEELIAEVGEVDGRVAEAMAISCRQRFQTDLAISTIGLADPAAINENHPVGTVYCAIAHPQGVYSTHFCWLGNQQEIQSRCAHLALNLARLYLQEMIPQII